MKKIGMLFAIVLGVFLMTGCGDVEEKEQKLVCTSTQTEDELSMDQVITMTYKNDKLKRMTMEVKTQITDSRVKDNWDEFKKSMAENNQEFNKDGISQKIEIDDQNYKYSIILDIDVENATEEALKEQGFEGLKDDDSTIEESKELAEKDGSVCVIE